MPSFDIVSEVNIQELRNAVDQAKRELENRFDFQGVDAGFEIDGSDVKQYAPNEFQLEQMVDILRKRLIARSIDLSAMELGKVETNLAAARRVITFKQGIDKAAAKKIIGQLKDAKLKVTTQIIEDKLRTTGKKRDDLQEAIALLKAAKQEQPLQFENFRD